MTNFEMVREFHDRFGHPVESVPQLPNEQLADLRIDLIDEELHELKLAHANGQSVEWADALLDLLYVVYGACLVSGIDADKGFAEVHRSNMSKLGENGKPIVRPDGKILKGPNYSPPDLKTVLGIES